MRRFLLAKIFVPAAVLTGSLAAAAAQEQQQSSNPDTPEVDACQGDHARHRRRGD